MLGKSKEKRTTWIGNRKNDGRFRHRNGKMQKIFAVRKRKDVRRMTSWSE